ncbi:MAG: hypothetical protein AAF849_02365 [Bacteroidota bacterium]
MKRRNFLRKSVLLPSLLGFHNLLWSKYKSASGLSMEQWKNVVDYARWCPTVHNLQAHRIQITSASRAALYYDTERTLPYGDPESVFLKVALGIFIEHLSIAAALYGKRIEVEEILPTTHRKGKLIHFANLKLTERLQEKEIAHELILKRRTSRIVYERRAISPRTLDKMKAEAEAFSHYFDWSSNPKLINTFMNINQKALFQDLADDDVRKELDDLFRYNQKQAKETRDGLSAKCMAFPSALIRSVFQKHKRWTKPPLKGLLKKTYLSKFKNTQTLAWFSGKFETSEDLVQSGRMFARAWLRATEDNCYLQPFGSLITNPIAYAQINEALPGSFDKGKIWMIFRIGHSDEPARSERLELNTILLKDEQIGGST